MDGSRGLIVGIGHDIQLIRELEGKPGLTAPGAMFTAQELDRVAGRAESLAALFSIKEAFFKGIPLKRGWGWTDLEIGHEEEGRPFVRGHGDLERVMASRGWIAEVSVSHSGEYVSSVVLIHT